MPGPAGNITSHDIYGPCCHLNVFVANGTFRGGQDARTYPVATEQDISTVATSLKASLDQSVQTALQTQVHSDETLITPPPLQANGETGSLSRRGSERGTSHGE
jgi:hypothetical protein